VTNQSEYLSYLPKIKQKYPEHFVRAHNKGRKEYRPPYGYTRNPKDKNLFQADYEKLYALEKALEYLDEGVSYRDAAEWLRQTTGEYVSHVHLYLTKKKETLKYLKAKKGITSKKLRKEKQRALINDA